MLQESSPARSRPAAAEAPSPGAAAINASALEQIRSLQRPGGPRVLHRVIALYFVNTPELLAAMRDAVTHGNCEALRQAAHSLKSTSANLGAAPLAELCRGAEEVARKGAAATEEFRLDAIEAEYERVRAALEAELERNT